MFWSILTLVTQVEAMTVSQGYEARS